MALFTAANARLAAARSVESRRKRALQRFQTPVDNPLPTDHQALQIASQTRAQIQAIDTRLTRAATMDAETLDLLTRAKERLWKVLAHAAQIPQPAHLKPERKRRQETIDLEPSFNLLPEPAEPSPMITSPPAQPSVAISAPETPPSPVVEPTGDPCPAAIVLEPEPAQDLSAVDLAALLSPPTTSLPLT